MSTLRIYNATEMRKRFLSNIGLLLSLLICLGIATSAFTAGVPEESPTATLQVRITGLPSADGQVKIGLYSTKEAYTSHKGSFRKVVIPLADSACEWTVQEIPAGEYAVMFYHDKNANHKLDKNSFGIPREPFGFSNNAKPRMGPPPFEQVRFRVLEGVNTIEIHAQGA